MTTHRSLLGVFAGTAVALALACTGGSYKEPPKSPTYTSYSYEPQLVAVDNGVWVLRDSDIPIYYVDDYYYTHTTRDNTWFRSTSPSGGWLEVGFDSVPAEIANRDHQRYVKYHGSATALVRPAPNVDVGESEPDRRKDYLAPPAAVGGGPRPERTEPKSLPPKGDQPF